MKQRPLTFAASILLLAPWASFAAPPQPSDETEKAQAAERIEPNVRRTVIEDDGSRIEELNVRGVAQKVTVKPKVGTTRSYEILMSDGSRDLSPGVNTSRGAAGQRVWNVISF